MPWYSVLVRAVVVLVVLYQWQLVTAVSAVALSVCLAVTAATAEGSQWQPVRAKQVSAVMWQFDLARVSVLVHLRARWQCMVAMGWPREEM